MIFNTIYAVSCSLLDFHIVVDVVFQLLISAIIFQNLHDVKKYREHFICSACI